MRSVLRNTSSPTRSCYSCSVALESAFAACRFCRRRYHRDCLGLLEGCALETCEGHGNAKAFDFVDRSPKLAARAKRGETRPEPGKPWWVEHKETTVRGGVLLCLVGLGSVDLQMSPWFRLGVFALVVFGAIAFTLLTPSADD